MMAKDRPVRVRRRLSFRMMLTPIMALALAIAAVAWTAAWFFRDTFIFAATLIGIGCLPIVVAVVSYLLVLLNKLDSK